MAQATVHSAHQGPPPPRRQRKIPYRDAISKSAPYYDIYEMIRRPHAHHSNRPPDPPSYASDPYYRPPTKQQKLEKKIQKKFEKNNHSLPGDRFAALGKVLKALFLVFVLPFYLLLYYIPKGIFTGLIPFVFKQIDRLCFYLVHRIKLLCQKLVKKVLTPFQMIKTTWQNVKIESQTPKKELKTVVKSDHLNFFAFIFQGFWMLYNLIVNPFVWAYRAIKKSIQAIRNFPKRVQAAIQRVVGKVKKNIQDVRLAIRNRIKQIKHNFNEKVCTPVRIGYRSKIDAIKERVTRFFTKIKAVIQSFYFKVKWVVLNPLKALRSLKAKVTHAIEQKVQKIVVRAKNLRKRVLTAINDRIQRIKTWFSDKYIKPVIRVLAKIERYKTACFKVCRSRIPEFKAIPEKIKAKIPDLSFIKFDKVPLFLSKIKRRFKKFYAFVPPVQQRCQVAVAMKIRFLEQKVMAGLSMCKKRCVQVLDPIKQRVLKPVRVVKQKCYHLSLRIRLLYAWAKVLIRYGMHIVRNTADDMGKWLQFQGNTNN